MTVIIWIEVSKYLRQIGILESRWETNNIDDYKKFPIDAYVIREMIYASWL